MITTKAVPLALLVFLTAASQSMLRASPQCVDADCIPAGFDFFVTMAGTSFTINGVQVPLTGIPDYSKYGADTIVQRLGNIDVPDIPGATQTVNTQMTELNLKGVDPACAQTGGTACFVFITLDPTHATLGSLVFTQTIAGQGPVEGTFTSFFDIFFDLSFTTLGGATLPCDAGGDTSCLQELPLTGSGLWTDDNGPMFIVGGVVTETDGSLGVHIAEQIPAPDPASIVLFGTGLAGLLALARTRRLRG